MCSRGGLSAGLGSWVRRRTTNERVNTALPVYDIFFLRTILTPRSLQGMETTKYSGVREVQILVRFRHFHSDPKK